MANGLSKRRTGLVEPEESRLGPRVLGGRRLFQKKNPGSPGRLGKSTTKAESLAKLRGKGALA